MARASRRFSNHGNCQSHSGQSLNGRLANHKACVKGLGLRRINHTVEVQDTPENRGMINKAYYLLRVEG